MKIGKFVLQTSGVEQDGWMGWLGRKLSPSASNVENGSRAPEVDESDGAFIWLEIETPEVDGNDGAFIWLTIGAPRVVRIDKTYVGFPIELEVGRYNGALV